MSNNTRAFLDMTIRPNLPLVNFSVVGYIYRIQQNFRGGKLSRLCTKHTIHWKTFAVHQAHAIMYCIQQMIQGENFHDWLKNRENRESFPPRKFCRIRYISLKLLYKLFIMVNSR